MNHYSEPKGFVRRTTPRVPVVEVVDVETNVDELNEDPRATEVVDTPVKKKKKKKVNKKLTNLTDE